MPTTQAVEGIVRALQSLSRWVDDYPPIDQPMRFGNKAFRSWLEHVTREAVAIHHTFLPSRSHEAVAELVPYFLQSFGDSTRIDYGTGHETTFCMWLACLVHIGFLTSEDYSAMVLRCFAEYLKLMRRLQTQYMLEPAGSHGVWGLDDYQCLVFYFGSSQLIGQRSFSPEAILDDTVLSQHSSDYLYFEAIKFIREVKKGHPFAETSPMLHDMSALPSWKKTNSGLLKLYDGEVLRNLPAIQHMLFGSIFPCTWAFTVPPARTMITGHHSS